MEDNRIYWVRGNTQKLLIPLEQEIVQEEGDVTVEPYYPSEDADVTVTFKGKYISYKFTPVVDGSLLIVTDNGTLSTGAYGIEISVVNKDGTRYRSLWDNQVVVTSQNDSVLQEWDEFKQQDVKARAALFFFAKGDKGDAFTYDDFTPEQIEELQKPATDAAERLTDEVHALENEFTQAENERKSNETARKEAETQRGLTFDADHQQAVDDHEQYESDHTNELQRQQNELERQQSESGRVTNEDARQQAEEQRAETFAGYETFMHGYDNRLSALEITQEQFNEIFNEKIIQL